MNTCACAWGRFPIQRTNQSQSWRTSLLCRIQSSPYGYLAMTRIMPIRHMLSACAYTLYLFSKNIHFPISRLLPTLSLNLVYYSFWNIELLRMVSLVWRPSTAFRTLVVQSVVIAESLPAEHERFKGMEVNLAHSQPQLDTFFRSEAIQNQISRRARLILDLSRQAPKQSPLSLI